MTARCPTCVLIGSDSLLIECGDIWRGRGHAIEAVVTDAPRVASWARELGAAVIDADGDYASLLAERSFDYLFAITFLRVLPKHVLAMPKRAAINFHDGPLPRYAGLNAPTWALLRRERDYGITWHLMTEQVDRGDVLARVAFEIQPDDTSLSLNMRCFGAAIESFGGLIDKLVSGTEQRSLRSPAPDGEQTYFGRHDRPQAAALIDWQSSAQDIAALVRALDFGPRYPNRLGAPSVLLGERAYVVSAAEASVEPANAAAGTLIAAGFDTLSVACGEGTLLVRRLREPNGHEVPMSIALARLGIEVGARFVQLPAEERDALGELDRALVKNEAFWVDRLARLTPTDLPYATGAPRAGTPHYREIVLEVPDVFAKAFPGELALAAAFAAYAGRLGSAALVSLAWTDAALVKAAGRFEALLAEAVPLLLETEPATSFAEVVSRLAAEVDAAHARKSYLRNVGARYPELQSSAVMRDAALLPLGVAVSVDRPAGSVLQLQLDAGAARLRFDPARLEAASAAARGR